MSVTVTRRILPSPRLLFTSVASVAATLGFSLEGNATPASESADTPPVPSDAASEPPDASANIVNDELAAPSRVTDANTTSTKRSDTTSLRESAASTSASPPDDSDAESTPGTEGSESNRVGVYLQLGGGAAGLGVGVAYRVVDEVVLDAGVGGMFLDNFGGLITPWVEGSWLSGESHHFELGAGAAAIFIDEDSDSVRPVVGPHIGYRYQGLTPGFLFRATLHGFYMVERDVFGPWLGFSFGGTLK